MTQNFGTTDALAAFFVKVAAPALRLLASSHSVLPKVRAAQDKIGVQVRGTGYYEPTYALDHLPDNIAEERPLPGLDFNEAGQLEILRRCVWSAELREFPKLSTEPTVFAYGNGAYGPGDADMLYNFIRLFKPRRIVEIGSGNSTLMASAAIKVNSREDEGYSCQHICIEPYEMPWLESTGVTVIRQKVEHCSMDLFSDLSENDILFIDSSHVIRPYGDVLKEFQEIVPGLAPGVIVHVHDIHTPREYPASWVREQRLLWNEQYLLESFLAFNNEFEILAMANWLKHHHFDALASACGFVSEQPDVEPGAFWFRRKPAMS